uniref:Dual specificity protein phosphatase 1 n=1 Tax=Petromyzon marinus TaxID=7757 RepID=A0AAJ7SYM2_PETMA|nr:dual specificity protein phosphatase 1 [Petromyzon marinus]
MVIMDVFETEWSPVEPPQPIDCYVMRKLLMRERDGESRERDASSPSAAINTANNNNNSSNNNSGTITTTTTSSANNNIIITSTGTTTSAAASMASPPPSSPSLSPPPPPSSPLGNSRYLLLDCRSFLAYSASHVRGSLNVHTNPILLRRRRRGIRATNVPTSAGQAEVQAAESVATTWTLPLAQLLPSAEARARLQAGLYAAVVLVDERTRELSALRADSTLAMVALALGRETRGTPVYFLRGGYEKFHRDFSELCLDAALTSPCKTTPPALLPPVPIRLHTAGTPTYDQGGPVEILPFLYLGSAYHASRRELLDAIGITALLNVSADLPNHFEGLFTYKSIPVEDNHKADIGAWFLEAIDFIDSTRRGGGRVFVHCHAGVSRSATICLAYLMKTRRLRLDEAFEFVRQRRSVISPNFNFLGQLQSFEVQIQQQQQAAVRSPCCALPAPDAQPIAAAPAADDCVAGDPGSRSPVPSLQRAEPAEDGARDPGPSHGAVAAAETAPLQAFSFPGQPSLKSADVIGFSKPLSASSPC